MMNPTREVEDCQKRLEKLQKENSNRWQRIESLHDQLQKETTSEASLETKHPSERILDFLQTEIDLLPHNGVYDQCDNVIKQIEEDVTSRQEEMEQSFAAEVVESFQQLVETNRVLKESIQREEHKLQIMQASVVEQKEIQKTLKEMETELADSQASKGSEMSVEPSVLPQEETQLNEQLKEDLRYLASRLVDQEVLRNTNAQQAQQPEPNGEPTTLTLDELILKLLDRLLTCPEDPYVEVDDSRVRQEHLTLLKKCWMVQAFENDDNLIRLIDYHC